MNVKPPLRASHTYTQQLCAAPEAVFPLLCPVREADWIYGWAPVEVISASGLAEVNCVFITPAEPHNAIWTITRHEPAQGFVEMLKITPEVTVCRLSIQLAPTPTGSTATITYTHTSLGPLGDQFVEAFTEEYYREFMQDWERRLNYFLVEGVKWVGERGH